MIADKSTFFLSQVESQDDQESGTGSLFFFLFFSSAQIAVRSFVC